MDLAVLSDIHGNYIALERCIKYAIDQGISTFLFLGDYIGELAYPERAVEMLRRIREKYNCIFIKGNKEVYWTDHRKEGRKSNLWEDGSSTTGMMLYAYRHLSDADIDYFESLPIRQTVEIEGYEPFIICHGSPDRVNERMIPDSGRIYEVMDQVDAGLIIYGHTHVQSKTEYNGNAALNPGSVGIPFLSEGKTQFLILHSRGNSWAEEFISLEYDVDAVIKDMKKEKLELHAPYWNYVTKRLLKGGKINNSMVLDRAMELCRDDMGECNWPFIPEKYWEQAVKALFV